MHQPPSRSTLFPYTTLFRSTDEGRVVGILEVKTDGQDDADTWGRNGTDEIPLYYRTQVQWYLDVLGLEWAHVADLTARQQLRYYIERPDETDPRRTPFRLAR